MKGRKWLGVLLLLFTIFGLSLSVSSNTSAASIGTSTFDLNYRNNNSSTYQWANSIYFGRQYGISIKYGAARRYQINTAQTTAQGSYASLHFETNLVISTDDVQYVFGNWTNLDTIEVGTCSGFNRTLTPVASSISHAITEWTTVINGVTYYNSTLTIYGDVVLDNIPSGNTGSITCPIGSVDYAFYTNDTDNPDLFYFEQNPMTIEWSNNINDALLRAQISQTNVVINQNQSIIDQDNQDRTDLQNTSDNAEQSAENASTSVQNASSSLLVIIGNYINIVLNPPQSDCKINMSVLFSPFHSGDYGTADLCSLSVRAASYRWIGDIVLIALYVPFIISIIHDFLYLMKGATQD